MSVKRFDNQIDPEWFKTGWVTIQYHASPYYDHEVLICVWNRLRHWHERGNSEQRGNVSHALRGFAHAGQVLLLRQGSRVLAKPIPRNFLQKQNREIFAMSLVASLMPAKFSYYARGVSWVLAKPIPRNFMRKRNHEIFAMRFVASLMLAKFSNYDRGVKFSWNRFREIFCKNKIAKFLPCASSPPSCRPSSPTTTGEYRCRNTKMIPRNFLQ